MTLSLEICAHLIVRKTLAQQKIEKLTLLPPPTPLPLIEGLGLCLLRGSVVLVATALVKILKGSLKILKDLQRPDKDL